MQDRDAVLRELAGAERLAVTAHDRPDGDALGAALGLYRILLGRGVKCVLVGCRPVPERYAFLLGTDVFLPESEPLAPLADALVVLDTGMADRSTPAMRALETGFRVINIDHHASNTRFGALNWIAPTCGSAAEMVAELAREGGWDIPRAAAEALYTGIVTDTGRFCYENTTPDALRCAARLLECGVEPYAMNRLLYETVPEAELRLNGRAIQSLRRHCRGRVAVVSLERADYAAFGCGPEMSGEAINLPRRIEGVRVALFLYEPPDETHVKISIRTEAPLDAVALAREFGGGGHTRAAGASFAGSLAGAERAVLDTMDRVWGTDWY